MDRLLRTASLLLDRPNARRTSLVLIGLAYVVFGVVVVTRAELPKRKYVDRLRYDSPMQIDRRGDRQARYYSSEFRGFAKQAWGTIVERLDPYDPARFHVRAYPPFFNIVFFPFALPWRVFGLGSALYYTLSFGLGIASAWWLTRWSDGEHRFGKFVLVLVLMAPLAADAIARSETDLLVLGPVSAAMMLLALRRRCFLAGLLLGFAASFKVLPGLFGIYLLCTRRWAALAGMVAGVILCMVLLPVAVFGPQRAWDLHLSWYRRVVAPYQTEGAGAVVGNAARPSNQSLTGALERYLRPTIGSAAEGGHVNVAPLGRKTVRRIARTAQAVIAVSLVAIWLACARRDEPPAHEAVLFATVPPGVLLLSEISLTSHHLLLIVPLSAVVLRACAPGEVRAARWTWVVALYVAGVVGVAVPQVKVLTPLLPVTLALLVGCAAIAVQDRLYGAPMPASAATSS